MASRLKPKVIGDYEKYVARGRGPDNVWGHDIFKDIDRTFPEHPYFNKKLQGKIGQEQLKQVLEAYSVYNQDVGYC